MFLRDHTITVPLDHADPGGEQIEIYAREVAASDGADRPFLVYLQGGPGSEAPRPVARPLSPAWLGRALADYRVLMFDQRGTGRSTPWGGTLRSTEEEAARLRHFRADAIVRDAECLREHLGVRRWSLLGQSFGGFCCLAYLSEAPDSLAEVFITGGLTPVGRPVDDVYSGTFAQMRRLSQAFLRRYPEDRARLTRLLELCAAGEVTLADGAPVSPRLLRSAGYSLGVDGGAEALHHLLELDPGSPAFRADLAAILPWGGRNPLYSVIHESSYADGGATRWSAQRTIPEDFLEEGSLLLTGEHIFPWSFEEIPALAPYREIADAMALEEWPRLYDAGRLSSVDVPCAAIIYAEDPYVLRGYSEETAELIPSLRRWLTDEYLHNGVRSSGERVLDRLIELVREH
jgi:pimeloyl-ACP methyl ester carboxylesterase